MPYISFIILSSKQIDIYIKKKKNINSLLNPSASSDAFPFGVPIGELLIDPLKSKLEERLRAARIYFI